MQSWSLIFCAVQELYNVEHFAFNTIAITFWRLPVIFIVMFLVRGRLAKHSVLILMAFVQCEPQQLV